MRLRHLLVGVLAGMGFWVVFIGLEALARG
jgi:hypothetical protein